MQYVAMFSYTSSGSVLERFIALLLHIICFLEEIGIPVANPDTQFQIRLCVLVDRHIWTLEQSEPVASGTKEDAELPVRRSKRDYRQTISLKTHADVLYAAKTRKARKTSGRS